MIPAGAAPLPEAGAGVAAVLVRFLREEIAKFGFRRALVGLSGGLDSATALALGARALGPENILAVVMPYRTSHPSSLEHAQAMADAAGVTARVVDISPMVDAYYAAYPTDDRLRRGNKMARERMSILYDLSMEWGGLVLGTSNKTELVLGYGTLFGDMASAVNPLGDLWKTQVRGVAAATGVIPAILAKTPSADLWEGQSDEDELGFTYDEVDRLLHLMVDRRYGRDELVAAGFGAALTDRVIALVRGSQYKRLPPVIAKVSPRTINRDFRYPRDWGR